MTSFRPKVEETSKCPKSKFSPDRSFQKSLEKWKSDEDGLFMLNFISGDNGVSGTGQGKALASVYSTQLVGDSSQCSEPGDVAGGEVGDEAGDGGDSLTVGVSCCSRPSHLGTVWAAHSRPVLSALNSLHGLHAMLVDKAGEVLTDQDLKVSINKTEWNTDISSGHFWRLISVGRQEVTVGEVTKMVNVVPGQMNVVKFEVEQKLSSFTVLCLVAIAALLTVALFYVCR